MILGRAIDGLDMTESTDVNSILAMYKAGSLFGDQILERGGINYASAVKWCFESVLETAGLGNDRFCQNF